MLNGSIKEMEYVFAVSYPTIKSRLNRIAKELDLVEVPTRPSQSEVLSRLEKGEITVQEALAILKGERKS